MNNENNNFTYDYAIVTNDTVDDNSSIDNNVISSSSKPDRAITNTTSSHTTSPDAKPTKPNTDQQFKRFESNFDGIPVIIIEYTDSIIFTWHPLKWAKFLSTNFYSINNI
jgi:hypothetical protein